MNSSWNCKCNLLKFPLRLYLQQLFFGSLDKVILSPANFWSAYQISFLEKCWQQDIQQQLEEYLYDNWNFDLIEQYWNFNWMEQIEQPWERDCIQYLENCWLQE
jgi:hypothetical protein